MYQHFFCGANFGDTRGGKKKAIWILQRIFYGEKKGPNVAISQGEKTEITMFRQEVPACHQNIQCYFTKDNYIKE